MLNIHQATIVLVANTFNVSIFQQSWLIDNDIIHKDEFSGENNIFTPMAVNVSNPEFNFLVVPERMQLVTNRNFDQAGERFSRIIGKIADCLPHSPIAALGLNFDFEIPVSEPDRFFARHHELFVCPSNPLGPYFENQDARYGIYFSQNEFEGRLKLDVKPIMRDTEIFRLSFNYHREITKMEEIIPILDRWDEIFAHVQSIATTLDKRLEE